LHYIRLVLEAAHVALEVGIALYLLSDSKPV